MQLIVTNSKVISEYLGFEVQCFEDLAQNTNCKEFIEENKKYFYSTKPEEFIEFYNKTGIILEKIYSFNGLARFNAYGIKQNYPYKIFSNHLLIIDKETKVEIKNDILYLNDKKIRNIKEEMKKNEERFSKFKKFNEILEDVFRNPSFYDNFETEKYNLVINNMTEKNKNLIKEAKQLVMTPFYDIFILTYDGDLYFNDKIYAKNVEYIFEENIINKIIIYKDNNIEYLTSNYIEFCKKYDKVLYNKYFLALLKDKNLRIIIKDYEEYIVNKSHVITLNGVDEFYEDSDDIILVIGNQKIKVPIFENNINDIL